jgi:hypothetical protein
MAAIHSAVGQRAAGHGAAGRRRHAATAATSSAGMAITQWWVQEIGDTSNSVTAHSAKPLASSPARPARAARASPAAPVSTIRASHAVGTVAACRTRAISPSRLWFITSWMPPTCCGLRNVMSQYRADPAGCTTYPATTVTAKTPAATPAARYRRVASR